MQYILYFILSISLNNISLRSFCIELFVFFLSKFFHFRIILDLLKIFKDTSGFLYFTPYFIYITCPKSPPKLPLPGWHPILFVAKLWGISSLSPLQLPVLDQSGHPAKHSNNEKHHVAHHPHQQAAWLARAITHTPRRADTLNPNRDMTHTLETALNWEIYMWKPQHRAASILWWINIEGPGLQVCTSTRVMGWVPLTTLRLQHEAPNKRGPAYHSALGPTNDVAQRSPLFCAPRTRVPTRI